MIKKGSLAKRAEKQKKPIPDQQANLPLLKAPKLKSINLPKLKARDSTQAITAPNVPGPVLRILISISQTLDEDTAKEELASHKDSTAFQLSERNSIASSRDESGTLISEMSRISLSSSIIENLEESGGSSFEKSAISSEAKRKIIRSCLDLKRLIDKDSSTIIAESPIQKSLFSKSNTNVTVLFRCLKEISDIDTSIVITNLLLRLITTCESASSNMIMMTKKNLCQILLVTIYNIHHDYLNNSSISNVSLNILQRTDEIFMNIFTILCKLSKYEPKLALLARLHGAVPIAIKTLKRSVDKKDFALMTITFNILRIFASKNENNLSILQKSNLVPLIDSIFKNSAQQVTLSKLDNAVELMAYLAKSKSTASEIVKTFGMKFFLTHCCSVFEGLQKASLKAVKVLNDYASECVNMSLTSVNSVSSLLVGALRSAAGQADLPFMNFHVERTFPLPVEPVAKKSYEMNAPVHFESAPNLYTETLTPPFLGKRPKTSPNLTQSDHLKDLETDYENIIDVFAQDLSRGKAKAQGIPPQSIQDLVQSKFRKLCPELSYLENLPIAKCDLANCNISVRHVQPMAPGKHFVCRNLVGCDSEQLLRRSPMTFRTLMFDSRFESGNLQLAVKISQFEYDLLIESDINSGLGKHNQWFYFSVKRMAANTTYKFNILNLSKPASQFNNGMQPVMYCVEEPGWKRVGDYVFYIKNHYRKTGADPSTIDSAATDANTYSTLVMSITFKNPNDTCYFAYHYPYTYSELQRSLYQLSNNSKFKNICRRALLCRTLGGNDCILLTITDFVNSDIPIKDRKYVLLSARVHPGESNSSHMMNGLIQFLLSNDDTAVNLRRNCVFKVVPMLNPDGTINGSHRCSLAGLSCDFHGHSRKKNAFIFGCENPPGSEIEGLEKIFPQILAQQSSIFDFNACRFNIEKSKESTARVGMQVQIPDLEKMGVDFAKAVNTLLSHAEVNTLCSKNIAELGKSTPCSSDQSPITTPKRTRKVKKSTAKLLAKKGIETKKKEKKVLARDEPEENSDNSDYDSDG
ncbi:Cytosolic carboxypeptidase 1 [Terramyces sp. JEL0728]|nr:Cytosolic carboxypeptidase 1 [Terramyces sp. JEL0728]